MYWSARLDVLERRVDKFLVTVSRTRQQDTRDVETITLVAQLYKIDGFQDRK